MPTFTDSFDPAEPLGSRNASDIDNYIRSLKAALIERYELEHYSIEVGASGTSTTTTDSNAQGRHIAGLVGCIGRGTYAAMTALSAPGEGAFWIKTDTAGGTDAGTTYRYTSGAWVVSQLATGTIYCSDAEAVDGTTTDKAISPTTLQTYTRNTYGLFKHTPASGTTGTSIPATTWTILPIDDAVYNNISGVSVATNKITLPAGTYRISAKAPMVPTGAGYSKVRLGLWNDTDGAFLDYGMNQSMSISSGDWNSDGVTCVLDTVITLAAEKDIELQAYASILATCGQALSLGVDESYAQVEIWRI